MHKTAHRFELDGTLYSTTLRRVAAHSRAAPRVRCYALNSLPIAPHVLREDRVRRAIRCYNRQGQ